MVAYYAHFAKVVNAWEKNYLDGNPAAFGTATERVHVHESNPNIAAPTMVADASVLPLPLPKPTSDATSSSMSEYYGSAVALYLLHCLPGSLKRNFRVFQGRWSFRGNYD